MLLTTTRFVLLVMFVAYRGTALPDGAPSGACTNFRPRHRDGMNGLITPQNLDTSPYRIMMSRRNFTRNTMVRVWVMDNRTDESGYRGILLQARRNNRFDDGPLGTWQNAPRFTKLMTCSNPRDAVTHSEVQNVKDEDSIFEWKAPCDMDIGDIIFTATIAQTREMFWPRVTSGVVTEMRASGSGDDGMDDPVCDAATMMVASIWTFSIVVAAVIIS